jgi:hypothetical protein
MSPAAGEAEQVTILVLTSAAHDGRTPDFDGELAEFHKVKGGARYGHRLNLVHAPAADLNDLPGLLAEHRPTVLHFSGHSSAHPGLYFRKAPDKSQAVPVSGPAFAEFLRHHASQLVLVVLNSCTSTEAAAQIATAVDCCAIGTTADLDDGTAVQFTRDFYTQIAWGRSVLDALRLACSTVPMNSVDAKMLYQLHSGDEQLPEAAFVIPARMRPPPPTDAHKPYYFPQPQLTLHLTITVEAAPDPEDDKGLPQAEEPPGTAQVINLFSRSPRRTRRFP